LPSPERGLSIATHQRCQCFRGRIRGFRFALCHPRPGGSSRS
jgi:hypothetical protein